MKRSEDPYRATPPPWQGWPTGEFSRRRWKIGLAVPLIGAAGCGALFLLLMGLGVAVLIASRLSVPIPDGDPLVMSEAEVTGTWVDERGGRLVLRTDGTFASERVCGDFSDGDLGDATAPDPGAGAWELDTWDDPNTDKPVSQVHLKFMPSEVWTQYEARGTSKDPVLWTYLGDPDEGKLCVLEKASA